MSDRPTDPSTKFGARAAQVTVPVVGDDRPSIAELQRLHDAPRKEFFGQPVFPYEIRNAAPVLLEIAAAARDFRDARCDTQTHAWDEAERDDRLCFGAIHCESCPVDIALERLRAAAGKVMP